MSPRFSNAGNPMKGSLLSIAFPGYDIDSRASPDNPGDPGREPPFGSESGSDPGTAGRTGRNEADPETDSGMDGAHNSEGTPDPGEAVPGASPDHMNPGTIENPEANGIVPDMDGAIEPQALEGFEEQVLAQLEVTNMFLFHQEILLVFLVGSLVFSLVYRIIKHNVTSHFT